jgi:hypothetical protein
VVILLIVENFRSYVARTSNYDPSLAWVKVGRCQSEVYDLYLVLFCEENVLRLEVPVDNSF